MYWCSKEEPPCTAADNGWLNHAPWQVVVRSWKGKEKVQGLGGSCQILGGMHYHRQSKQGSCNSFVMITPGQSTCEASLLLLAQSQATTYPLACLECMPSAEKRLQLGVLFSWVFIFTLLVLLFFFLRRSISASKPLPAIRSSVIQFTTSRRIRTKKERVRACMIRKWKCLLYASFLERQCFYISYLTP